MKRTNNRKKIVIISLTIIVALTIILNITITNLNKNRVESSDYAATVTNANSNLIANYISNGVRIGGIEGTLEVLDTSDATATAADIVQGKTAYVNGVKLTGTLVP